MAVATALESLATSTPLLHMQTQSTLIFGIRTGRKLFARRVLLELGSAPSSGILVVLLVAQLSPCFKHLQTMDVAVSRCFIFGEITMMRAMES
jgi:hypothetical protein